MPPDPRPAVVIHPAAIETILNEARASEDGAETGGILMGVDSGATLEVRHAGGPGPAAIRRADYFLRDREHAQQLTDAAWGWDGSDWIGDWHTHPQGPPVPSRRDRATYRRILGTQHLGFQRFLTVIVVPERVGWEAVILTPWMLSAAGLQMLQALAARNPHPSTG